MSKGVSHEVGRFQIRSCNRQQHKQARMRMVRSLKKINASQPSRMPTPLRYQLWIISKKCYKLRHSWPDHKMPVSHPLVLLFTSPSPSASYILGNENKGESIISSGSDSMKTASSCLKASVIIVFASRCEICLHSWHTYVIGISEKSSANVISQRAHAFFGSNRKEFLKMHWSGNFDVQYLRSSERIRFLKESRTRQSFCYRIFSLQIWHALLSEGKNGFQYVSISLSIHKYFPAADKNLIDLSGHSLKRRNLKNYETLLLRISTLAHSYSGMIQYEPYIE